MLTLQYNIRSLSTLDVIKIFANPSQVFMPKLPFFEELDVLQVGNEEFNFSPSSLIWRFLEYFPQIAKKILAFEFFS